MISLMGHQCLIGHNAFMVKPFQNLVKIKILLLSDSDLKYNLYSYVIKFHR